MSYTPTEWHTGDIVTANKLNNLEQGVVDAQLPEYSASDNGKVLTLGEGESETVVIVPEQTVTLVDDEDALLNSALTDYFVEGTSASLKVDGNTYNVTCDENLIFEYDNPYFAVYYMPEPSGGIPAGVYFTASTAGEHTVSLTTSATSVEPKWEASSGLPAYTSADIGKVLTVSEDAEHPTLQTLIEEQSATLANNGMVWVAPLNVLNSAYFENAEVGDKCFIKLDGGNETESTAIDVSGYILFPISTFYVGYASMFGGIGIASLSEPSEKTHTVEVKANAPSAVAMWKQGKDVVVLPSANEIGTYVTNTLSTRKNSASGLGIPSYADIDASVIASDNDAFDNMFNIFVNAVKNDKMIKFDRHFATSYSYATSGTDVVNVQASFTDPFYNRGSGDKVYNAEYMLRLWYATGNVRHYGIYSCITLISQALQ